MSSPAVEYAECLSYAYPQGERGADGRERLALDRISLTVNVGERLGVLGPNGGGKSTLLKLTLGLLTANSGQIRVFGQTPDEARRRRLIGYVPQRNSAELKFPLTAAGRGEWAGKLGLAAWKRLSGRAQREDVERAMRLVGAAKAWPGSTWGACRGSSCSVCSLPGPSRYRPKLLLLDEPTVGIDVAGQQQFADLLKHLHDDLKLTVMVVSHDIRTVAAGCDRVACLSRTLHSHTAPEGLTPAVLAEVFRHDVAAIFGEVHVDAHAAAGCSDPRHRH